MTRYVITIEADVTIDAPDAVEATTRAHAMMLRQDGVGMTRIVRVHEYPEAVE